MNRYTTQFVNCLQKEIVKVFARVSFGAAGAPTIVRTGFNSQGLVSVTHNGTGQYTFVFGTQAGMLDVFNLLLNVSAVFDATGSAGAVPAAPLFYVTANAVSTAAASLQLTFTDKAQAAADPASGEAVNLEFTMKNSNAP